MIERGKARYHGVLDIPEGTLGRFEIKHKYKPAGTIFALASARTAILGGDKSGSVRFAKPTRWHMLLEDGGVWMSDIPIEQAQHDDELKGFRSGSVLIGGLGLGYAATVLALRPRIGKVTVVEKSDDVIGLVWKHLLKDRRERGKLEVVHADLFDYLKHCKETSGATYANAFYDIWQSDSEDTFHHIVVPLIRLSEGVVKNRPVCWNENVMRGQLYMGMSSRAMMNLQREQHPTGEDPYPSFPTLKELAEPAGNIWHDWSVPFFQWMLKAKPDEAKLNEGIRRYVRNYGLPVWQGLWNAGL